MKKKIKYSDGEIKEVKIINDFLPAPENLILKDNSVKITTSLSKESVDFFKSQASKHHIPYQKMIKTLLDKYVNRYM
ncbi:CopG family transcriptional regulator [Rickettsia endosymbiont of Oedothorax gibbosus]|uniref:CopG family transcriptional regulator n=1 Tax=Rickettsia endosymbiont of Oedothorax gibbosus TaxID=931099 RepID=UPI002024F1CC|nr:CopG family transcriptional regulator [Rickettsia endosymbiont of Oedothorax gibbosus]